VCPGFVSPVRYPGLGAGQWAAPDAEKNASGTAHRPTLGRVREATARAEEKWRERRLDVVAGTPRDVGLGADLGGRRRAGLGGGLVRIAGAMAAGPGVPVAAQVARLVPELSARGVGRLVLGLGARGAGRAVPGVVGRVPGGRTPVAGVVPQGMPGRAAGRRTLVRVALARPLLPATVLGALRGSRALRAVHAEAGRLPRDLEGDRPGRAGPGTGRRRGKAAGRPVSGRPAPGVLRVAGHRVAGHRGRGVAVTGK
jgi:hypothetical protein